MFAENSAGLRYIVSIDFAVSVAVLTTILTTAWIYLKRRWQVSKNDREKDQKKIPLEEDDQYLQEVARCALLLANHTPKPEEYPDFLRKENVATGVFQNLDSRSDGMLKAAESDTKSTDGDSMLVNLPDNLEEEHDEIELSELTADDISIEEEAESDSDLSPQDMAEIAEELNTSMLSIDSLLDDEAAEHTKLLTQTDEAEIFEKCASTNFAEGIPLVQQAENKTSVDSGEKTLLKDQLPEGDNQLVQLDKETLSAADECSALLNQEESASVSSQKIVYTCSKIPNYPSPKFTPKKLNLQKYEEINSSLTKEEKELEKSMQERQLIKIRELMRNDPAIFGDLSDEDLQSQFRLYCM